MCSISTHTSFSTESCIDVIADKGSMCHGAKVAASLSILTCRLAHTAAMTRDGQNRIYTPYMTVYLVISLPKVPYIHRIYMVVANPSDDTYCAKKVHTAQTLGIANVRLGQA